MRVLIAFDKFKDALTARQACDAAARALRTKHPGWELDLCPLTDGGEGFCDILGQNVAGRSEHIKVYGPAGLKASGTYCMVERFSLPTKWRILLLQRGQDSVGVVEMASASGLTLLPEEQRDPWQTTSLGTGQLMEAAVGDGADVLLLGIGGSATNDLGLGALAALGFKFFAAAGESVAVPTPATWDRIQRIDCSGATSLPPVFIACDVINPLLGPQGATATFGPQKGLKPADLPRLEAQMARMTALLCTACGQPLSLAETPGAGAAGGIGFGLMVACGAKLVPGFELVSDWLDLDARVARADLVITGEGRFDATSLGGKGPGRLLAGARRLGKPGHVFAGSLGLPVSNELHPITPAGLPLADALRRSAELLGAAVARTF